MDKEWKTKKGTKVKFSVRKTTNKEKAEAIVGLGIIGTIVWWLFFK